MFFAALTARPNDAAPVSQGSSEPAQPGTIETRLWLEEHEWLYDLLRSEHNVSPTFRFPDLISACVSLVFLHDDAPSAHLRLPRHAARAAPTADAAPPRIDVAAAIQLLLEVQRSPANRHPNPKFQLDQLTTACVALCRQPPTRTHGCCGRPGSIWSTARASA